jgi:hypothetical protein
MKEYSTAQAAHMIGIHKVTLQRWLLENRVKEPRKVRVGNVDARIWTIRDVKRIQKFKAENYRKGRGRKSKAKR